jgi:hypothetical protein
LGLTGLTWRRREALRGLLGADASDKNAMTEERLLEMPHDNARDLLTHGNVLRVECDLGVAMVKCGAAERSEDCMPRQSARVVCAWHHAASHAKQRGGNSAATRTLRG